MTAAWSANREWSPQEDGDYLTWLALLSRIDNAPRVIDFACRICGSLRTAPATSSELPICCGSEMVGLFHTLRPSPEANDRPIHVRAHVPAVNAGRRTSTRRPRPGSRVKDSGAPGGLRRGRTRGGTQANGDLVAVEAVPQPVERDNESDGTAVERGWVDGPFRYANGPTRSVTRRPAPRS